MLATNFAASRRINPAGASFKLTEAQVWKGHEIKARNPTKFISSVTSSEVTKDIEKWVRPRIFLSKANELIRSPLNVSFGGNQAPIRSLRR
jgi:hypothetical protein